MSCFRFAFLLLALLLSGVFFPSRACAQSSKDWANDTAYQTARQALKEKRYSDGLALTQRAANDGYPPAMFNMGLMTLYGWSVPKNESQSRQWFEKASMTGFDRSDPFLADMYADGVGGPVRQDKAAEVLTRMANSGNASAEFSLGVMYDTGRGVPESKLKALSLYQTAANKGHARAAYNAGQMLLTGDTDVSVDVAAAIEQFKIADALNEPKAQMALAYIYRSGASGIVDYARAKTYLYKAQANQAPAASRLLTDFNKHALAEFYGLQKTGQHSLASRAAQQLCTSGQKDACYEYGQYLLYGADGVPVDAERALKTLSDVCQTNPEFGCDSLYMAVIRYPKLASKADTNGAYKHFDFRCQPERDNPQACYALALMHYNNDYGMANFQKAKSLSVQACFNDSYEPACPMARHIINAEAASYTPTRKKSGGLFSGFLNAIADFGTGMATASSSGYSYSARTYSSGSYSSPTPIVSTSSSQDWTNFNNAVNAINNIGTGYNSTCYSSNPYC